MTLRRPSALAAWMSAGIPPPAIASDWSAHGPLVPPVLAQPPARTTQPAAAAQAAAFFAPRTCYPVSASSWLSFPQIRFPRTPPPARRRPGRCPPAPPRPPRSAPTPTRPPPLGHVPARPGARPVRLVVAGQLDPDRRLAQHQPG